jgi:signal transduction histidine kinase
MTARPLTHNLDDELRRLAAVARYDLIDGDVPGELLDICALAAQLVGVHTTAVNVLDDRHQHQVASYGLDPCICELTESMCYTTLLGGEGVILADASRDPRYARSPWVDGRLGSVRFYCSMILRTPEGEPVGTLCVFDEQPRTLTERQLSGLRTLARQVVDVLELRARSRQLESTVEELSRSHQELAAFAGQVSHDLKTPLTASLGFTELLQELPSVAADPVAQGYLARCRSSGRRMLTLVDDLLAYARVGGKLKQRAIALDDVMPQVLDDLGALAHEADIRWTGECVVADPAQLRVLLQNLVGNACKYRSPNRRPRITVTAAQREQVVRLQVTDNGPGIPTAAREEALAPLTRLNTQVAGSGLGLATCARIAEAHGSTLQLGDAPGGGLTATIDFPR